MCKSTTTALLATIAIACAPKQDATSSGGKALLDAYVAAWNHHDSTAFDTLLASGATHDDFAQGFHGKGAAQVTGFMRELIKLEPDFNWVITKVVESGPTVMAEWTWTATYTGPSPNGPVTKLRISGPGASAMEHANGKIVRFADYYDNASYFAKADSARK